MLSILCITYCLSSCPALAIEFSDVVATIEGKDITFEELLPKKKSRETQLARMGQQRYAQWILRYASASLRSMLLTKCRASLQDELALSPSETQIQDFVSQLRQNKERELIELRAQKELLSKELERGTDLGAEAQNLTERLSEIDTFIESIETYRDFAANHKELRESLDEDVARRFLTRWLIDRELFLKYGGRVAFRYGGPEPIDAYIAYLKEKREAGAFVIHSKILEQQIWAYFFREGRVLLIPDEDAQRIYASPTWSLDSGS